MEAPKIKFWDHQLEGINALIERKFYALFWEQGTGKTLAVLQSLRKIFTKEKRIPLTLIICPLVVCNNWANDAQKLSDKLREQICVLNHPSCKKRIELAVKAYEDGKRIFVTNCDWLSQGSWDEFLEAMNKVVASYKAKEAHRRKLMEAVAA